MTNKRDKDTETKPIKKWADTLYIIGIIIIGLIEKCIIKLANKMTIEPAHKFI